MAFDSLPGNLIRVREHIARTQAAEGLSGEVAIVAVTKGHPPAAVTAALDAGLCDVGENRVQEALAKQEALAALPVRWHLIGHVQTNKAKFVPDRFAMVHAVDSRRVAGALARARCHRPDGPQLQVLVQVNVAGEVQKSGCSVEEVTEVVSVVAGQPELALRGLMTMAPLTEDESVQRNVFGGLRRLRDELGEQGYNLPELSMGMSGDYRAAVAEGATILRLGTVLFGERP